MKPLCIQAHVRGELSLPYGYLHLDSLLAAAVCVRDNIPPAYREDELVPIEIPIQREPAGRFHLLSASELKWETRGLRYTQRRFPIEQAQGISRMKRVQITAGPCKSFRTPYETGTPEGPLTWWAIGDPDGVRELLALIGYLGKKRSVGNGKVDRWDVREVAETELWDGFPVMRDGYPLRHLPWDWPGLADDCFQRMGCLSYPYWLVSAEEMVAAPNAAA